MFRRHRYDVLLANIGKTVSDGQIRHLEIAVAAHEKHLEIARETHAAITEHLDAMEKRLGEQRP